MRQGTGGVEESCGESSRNFDMKVSNGGRNVQSNLWHMYGIFSRGTNAIQNYYLQSKTGYIQKSRIMCRS